MSGFMSGNRALALRLAVRELRGGFKGFYVLIASIALGVAAITSVGMLTDALRAGLADQGRVLLGGDLSFSQVHTLPDAEQRMFIGQLGQLGETARLRTLARLKERDGTVLVDLKAVDEAYPLAGVLQLQDGGTALGPLFAGANAFVDPLLLPRLGVKLGDQILLGELPVTIAGIIRSEPDRLAGRINFGPRVMVSRRTLLRTGLVQPGSLIRWGLQLRVDGNSSRSRLQAIKKLVRTSFPDAGFSVKDRYNPSSGIDRAINRFSQFLTLIGLTALFIGGIGVANAVASHMAKKRRIIATMKSLGASSRLIFRTYLIHTLLLSAIGITLGLAIGSLLPLLLNQAFGHLLPVPLVFGLPPAVVATAAAYGLLVALIFMLWPLGAARQVRAATLYRAEIAELRQGPGWRVGGLVALLLLLLVGLTVMISTLKLISLAVCIALVALYGLFFLFAQLLRRLARRLPRSRIAELSLARASLSGPTPLIRTVVQSLGIGLSLLFTVSLVESSLIGELKTGLPQEAPDFFVLDIDKQDIGPFAARAKEIAPRVRVNEAPMLRGRLLRLAGQPADEAKVAPGVRWIIRGDRGVTYAEELPKNSRLVAGTWWPKDYDGKPLVSMEAGAAKGLGLKLGDEVTVNILGRNIEAEVANLREVKWESLSINFVMIFSPNTLAGAPFKMLATLNLPGKPDVEKEGALIAALIKAFPGITPIAVRDALDAVNAVVSQVLRAVKLAGGVILLAGAIALAGALAATHQQRLQETVVFKVLGATRRRIMSAHLIEYLALALFSALAALFTGGLGAWLLVTQIMDMSFSLSWWSLGTMLLIVLALVLPLGLAGTWRMLGQKATGQLRRAE